MRELWTAIGIAMIAVPASAQINTTCSRIGQFTNCQTNGVGGAPGVNWQAYSQQMIEQQNRSQAQTMAIIQQARERKQADQAALAQRQAELDQQVAESNRAYADRQVGGMIAAHDCDNAKSIALKNGRFDLADRVAQFCTPTPKAP